MCEEKKYNIDLEAISDSFQFKEKGLTHKQGNKYKLLPYAANEKTLVSDFTGVVGSFSRLISEKELKGEFNEQDFIERVTSKVEEFEGVNSKEAFKDIIKTMFIDENNLVDFDIKTLNYISSEGAEDKIAKFLYSVLVEEELKELAKGHYDREVENILYKLVLDSLPELKKSVSKNEGYNCYTPYVKEMFIKDFKFMIENEEFYKKSIKRVIEYYYMFYVSQLAMKLSKFEKYDSEKIEPLYYTLSFENTSKNRTCYKFGWEKLKSSINSLFSHAITLELLNHHGQEKQYGYKELFELFNELNEDAVVIEIQKIFEEYTSRIQDKDWDNFNPTEYNSGNKGFDMAVKLFEAVEYQFIKSSRTRAYDAYKNWYVRFYYDNFAKRRGQLGYNLNLTEEDIILITKLCINRNEKLKLSVVFEEFEKRGIYFDRDSRSKIVQLYEKLNLLEKKSDSGDAQYVRSVL
ncbi:MAG: DNA phosphorothioation-dependent restriction protein DptG [Clostridium sp.]